jgi:hypothetical protein
MVRQGQTFELTRRGPDGERLWAYRHRTGGRDSKRIQRGGFASEQDARDALERELERLWRERRITRRLTLSQLEETYLDQHAVQPVTIEKLRYLLGKATAAFGDRKIGELTSQEIAAWRMTLSPGYRFEATQALRQVLHRAVAWGMIDVNRRKSASTTLYDAGRSSIRSSRGLSWRRSLRRSGRGTGRWSCSPRRPDCGRRNGSRSRNAMSTARNGSFSFAAPSREDNSRSRRRRRAREQCRCKHARSTRSTGFRTVTARRCFSRRAGKLPRHSSLPTVPVAARAEGCGHCADAAGLRSPAHLRNLRAGCRAFHLRPLALHGCQLDDDRPPLRSPRPRWTRARDQAPRRVEPTRVRPVDAGGRSVDAETTGRRHA